MSKSAGSRATGHLHLAIPVPSQLIRLRSIFNDNAEPNNGNEQRFLGIPYQAPKIARDLLPEPLSNFYKN